MGELGSAELSAWALGSGWDMETAMTVYGTVVVPATPPRPPQISLMGSAIRPDGGSDPANPVFEIDGETMAMLPGELQAELQARQGDSWIRGITYQPENQRPPTIRDPQDETTDDSPGANAPIVIAIPYIVRVDDSCSSFGFLKHDFKGRALRLLEAATPFGIEREFWTGTQAQASSWPNNYLCNPDSFTDITPGGGPPSVARGQQLLQDALASGPNPDSPVGFGGQGMIHCQQQTTPSLLNVRRVGSLMLDEFDNIFVPGVGYTGECADVGTPADGTAVMFATDLVQVRAEVGSQDKHVYPDSFEEATNRDVNLIEFWAQKFAIAYFDGVRHYAIRVTLPT